MNKLTVGCILREYLSLYLVIFLPWPGFLSPSLDLGLALGLT
jgi:hypothetical protein